MTDTRVPSGFLPRHQRRAVLVRVMDGSREVDSFEAASAQTLRAALRPILAHLDEDDAVQFEAVEEDWLPLGFDRVRREVELRDLEDAVCFLAA